MSEMLLNGKIELRPKDNGRFDELVMYHDGKCIVHAEMMNSGCLWIGFYPPGEIDRVVMWINVKKRSLDVQAHRD